MDEGWHPPLKSESWWRWKTTMVPFYQVRRRNDHQDSEMEKTLLGSFSLFSILAQARYWLGKESLRFTSVPQWLWPYHWCLCKIPQENWYWPGKEILRVAGIAQWPWQGKPVLTGKRNPTRRGYISMTVMGETSIDQEEKSSYLWLYPNDRDGGKPVLSGKRYPTCHGYSPMTMTGGNRYWPGKESYAPRVYPNDHDWGRPVLAGKGNPMRHEYSPMTVILFLAFVYENENENENENGNVLCKLVFP